MPTSSIAQILLRLFALNWFLSGLIQLASMAFSFHQSLVVYYSLIPGIGQLVAGAVFWAVSPKLSRFLAHRNDEDFHLNGITERQLYSAVFLGLGLYFALSSFAAAFSWLHFFAVSKSPDYGFHQENQPSYYDLSETVMTLAAGIVLICTCKTWAAKLARNRNEMA